MRACFGRVVRLRSQAAGQIGRLRGQTHGYPRSPLPSKRPENVRRTARMPHARVTPPGVPRASRLRMHKRKLLIGLATAGLLLAGFGAATMPASAEQRPLLVTLVGGAQATVTGDVPPGTPPDQIQIPGVSAPIASVQDITPAQPAPAPSPTQPPVQVQVDPNGGQTDSTPAPAATSPSSSPPSGHAGRPPPAPAAARKRRPGHPGGQPPQAARRAARGPAVPAGDHRQARRQG